MLLDGSNLAADTAGGRNQSFAFLLSIGLCLLLGIVFAADVLSVNDPTDISLESRINPNNAPAVSLIRLPGIGVSRAAAIVAYRESAGWDRAFKNCRDLQKVKGIGPKTAEGLADWVEFE